MSRKRRDEDALVNALARANPVTRKDVQGEVDSETSQRILRGILQEQTAPRPEARRPTTRLAWVLAAIVAVVLAVTLLLTWPVRDTAQAGILEDAARTASERRLPQIGSGDYLYVKRTVIEQHSATTEKGSWAALVPQVHELWIAADGSGRKRITPGTPRFLTSQGEQAWEDAGSPPLGGPIVDRVLGPDELGDPNLLSLPTGPDRLLRVLRADPREAGVPRDVAVFVRASDLLSQPLAPSRLRAALYRVLARLPGIEVLGPIADPLGRQGVGVAITTGVSGSPERRVLIFSSDTSLVLATQDILLESNRGAAPMTIGSTIEVVRTIVPDLHVRPSS
jgi:hypothetical protein